MNLDDALKLFRRAQHEEDQARLTLKRDEDLPFSDLCVTTFDGEDYTLMWFEGSYSDYRYVTCDSEQAWDISKQLWWQAHLNPDGEWAHRRVVMQVGEDRGGRHRVYQLDCRHEQALDAWGGVETSWKSQGDIFPCSQCQKDPDQLFHREAIKAEQYLLADKFEKWKVWLSCGHENYDEHWERDPVAIKKLYECYRCLRELTG